MKLCAYTYQLYYEMLCSIRFVCFFFSLCFLFVLTVLYDQFLGVMQQYQDKKVQDEFDTKDFSLHLPGSRGWHYDIGDNFFSPNLLPKSTSSVTSSSNQLNFGPFVGHISELPGSGSNLKFSRMVLEFPVAGVLQLSIMSV